MRNGSCTTSPAMLPSDSRLINLSSESKPISLILSAILFSAIALPAPFAMIGFEEKTPRRLGLAVIKSVIIFNAVVAMPSATLSAASFKPGYLAFSSSLQPLARWSAGERGDQPHIPLWLAIFRRDSGGETVGGDAAALDIIGLEEGGEGL